MESVNHWPKNHPPWKADLPMAVLRRWRNDYPVNEVIYLSPQTPLPSTVAPLLSLFPFFFSFSFRYPHSPKHLAISPNKHPIKGHIVSFLSSGLPLPPKQLNMSSGVM